MFEDEIPLTTALYVPVESVLEGSIAKTKEVLPKFENVIFPVLLPSIKI